MASEFGELARIGGGLLMSIIKVLGLCAFSAGLFFLVRWIQKGTKKQKAFTMEVNILDMNGVLVFDKIGFMKSEKTGLLEMQFQKRKSDSVPPIPKHLIKNNNVLLLNYAPGHYCVIDTYKTMKNLESGDGKIELVNLGMKKYLMSKQREILNKAEDKKRKWEQYAPWITLSIGIVSAVLLSAFLMYAGIKLEGVNIAQRILECQGVGWK